MADILEVFQVCLLNYELLSKSYAADCFCTEYIVGGKTPKEQKLEICESTFPATILSLSHTHTNICTHYSLSFSAFILFYFPLSKPLKILRCIVKITWHTILPLLFLLMLSFPFSNIHISFLLSLPFSHEQSYICYI